MKARAVVHFACLLICVVASWMAGTASAQIGRQDRAAQGPAPYLSALRLCTAVGAACCPADDGVKAPHCHKGLGCDIASGTCRACGGPGQPCCDGHLTNFSGRSFTGIPNDPTEKVESCAAGARCDARLGPDGTTFIGSRTCVSCGTQEGGACCAADLRYALGGCSRDAATGARLACANPEAGAASTCVRCGTQAGEPACNSGRACSDGLNNLAGICRPCGLPGMPVCDTGAPCVSNHVPDPSSPARATCVPAGSLNQWCLPGRRCGYQDLICNTANRCERCGSYGNACCAGQQGRATCEEGTPCTNGRCQTKPLSKVCNEYAWKAVRQSVDWFDRACGPASDRWQTNFQNHFNWCMQAGEARAARETRARAGPLSQCSTSSPPRSQQPQRISGEVCAASVIVTVDQCFNSDGTPSQYLDPGSTRVTACGSSTERALERARQALGFPLSESPAPGQCTYTVERMERCLCP